MSSIHYCRPSLCDSTPFRGAKDRCKPYVWLLTAIVLAGVINCLIVARSPLIALDGITFIELAQELAADPASALRNNAQHPGFPFLINAARPFVRGIAGDGDSSWVAAARLVSGLCSVASVALIWLFTRRILSANEANYCAILFAFTPVIRQNAADALSDAPHLMLYLCAMWLTCEGLARRRGSWFFFAGVSSGLAFWIRPEGLSVAIVAAGLTLPLVCWRERMGLRQAAMRCLPLVLGAVLVAGPYVMITGEVTKKVTSKRGWSALQSPAVAADSSSDGVAEIAGASRSLPTNSPAAAVHELPVILVLGKALLLVCVRFTECLLVLLLVYFVGLPQAMRDMNSPARIFVWALALSHIALLLALYWLGGYIDRRHLLPLLTVVLPIAARGMVWLYEQVRRFSARDRRLCWLPGFVVVAVLAILTPRCLRPLHQSHLHKLAAGRWIKRHLESGDLVSSNSRHILLVSAGLGKTNREYVPPTMADLADAHFAQRFRFVAIEQGSESFNPAWPAQLTRHYKRAFAIREKKSLRQRNIVIYEANTKAKAMRPGQIDSRQH